MVKSFLRQLMPLNASERKLVRQIARNLRDDTFLWGSTPQGADYWNDVYNNLLEIGKSYCEACKREFPND